MQTTVFLQRLWRILLVSVLLGLSGFAQAQPEPTMAEIYSTAQAGKLEQAQVMVQQVLVAHPNSAKAHFVQSELYARQGNVARAREALANAEKLAPGLPFAKAQAVQALRAQLSSANVPVRTNAAPIQNAAPVQSPATSSGWMLPALLAGGAIVLGYFLFRRKTQAAPAMQAAYSGGLNGPQSFGAGNANAMQASPYGQPAYGQPGYGQPGYGQPAGSGLGGRIMGGVATGLAVGAGVMAAQAIGRNLMGNHEQAANTGDTGGANNFEPLGGNTDMGGQDFGINDTSSWDSGADAGGGDWDN